MNSPGIREQTLVICALIGSAQMTWGVVVPVLPLYTDLFGISLALLGPIVAAFAIGRAVANLPAGMLLRRLPPRPYLWSAAAALLAVTALTGLAVDVGWLIAARLVAGILGGTVVTVGFAALVAGAPVWSRGSVMATATVVQMSAAATGAVLGGAVVEWLGVALTFVVAAVPLALCLVWEAVRPARAYWDVFAAPPPAAPPGARRAARQGPLLTALCAVAFATFFARFAGEQGLVPVLAYDGGGLTPVTLGIAMAVGTIVSLATLPVAGRLADRGVRAGLLLPGSVIGAASLAVLPALGTPWAFGAAIVAYSVATSVVNIVPGVITAEGYPPQAVGTVVGLTRTAGDLGAAIGPLMVFALAAIVGDWAASGALALVFLAAIVLFTWVIRHNHASPPAEEPSPMTSGPDAATPLARADGPIVPGARRGRDLGYPTANIAIEAASDLPADGVYLGWFHVTGGSSAAGALREKQQWPSLISIGTNPTFPGGDRTVEAYLLDFDDDLYGLQGHVGIGRLLRRQQTFPSAQELAAAMRDDERRAREMLTDAGHRLPYAAGDPK